MFNDGGWDPVSDGQFTYGRSPGGRLVSQTDGITGLLAGLDRHGDLNYLFTSAGVVTDSLMFDPFVTNKHPSLAVVWMAEAFRWLFECVRVEELSPPEAIAVDWCELGLGSDVVPVVFDGCDLPLGDVGRLVGVEMVDGGMVDELFDLA